MIDPPRPEAIEAVAACRAAGIAVKMITGDHALTAAAIGKELGLTSDGEAFTGAALARGGPSALRTAALDTAVFARVAPQKLELVDALQQAGHVVAMTGDGVNDGPALTAATMVAIGFQAFYMLNCRSLRGSLFAIGLTSNRWVFVGIGTVALLQGAFIYTRPLQTVFGTLPLGGKDLLLSMTVSAMILPLIGFEKWLTSRAVRKGKGRGSVEEATP